MNPPKKSKRWITRAAGGITILGLTGAVLHWTAGGAGKSPASNDQSGSDKCESQTGLRLGGPSGASVEYSLEYTASLCSGDDCSPLVALSGELEVAAQPSPSGSDETVQLQLRPSQNLGNHLPSREELSVPMSISVAPTGAIESLSFARPVDRATKRLLESIVREIQVHTPRCWSQQRKWSAVEELVPATVMSDFGLGESPREIRWQRKRVLEWRDGDAIFPMKGRATALGASQHQAQVDESGFVTALSGSDAFIVQTASAGGKLELHTKISVKQARSNVAQRLASNSALTTFTEPEEHSSHADAERIGGHSLKSIVQELARLKNLDDVHGPTRSRLYVAAAALLRRNVEAAQQTADLIRQGHDEEEFLVAALGDAATLETANLLSDLLSTAETTDLQLRVLKALGKSRFAEPNAVEAMEEYFDSEVGGMARLMTGALAYETRDSMPATSTAATDALVGAYQAAKDPLVRADTLRALGNSGSLEAITLAGQAATSSNDAERAAAAQGLRRVASDAADRQLARLMEDEAPSVRRAALDAALYRDPTEILVPVVQRLARLDTEATVRREAIRVLVRWKDEVPSVRDTLAWVSKNDPEVDLRAVAAEGLARFPT